ALAGQVWDGEAGGLGEDGEQRRSDHLPPVRAQETEQPPERHPLRLAGGETATCQPLRSCWRSIAKETPSICATMYRPPRTRMRMTIAPKLRSEATLLCSLVKTRTEGPPISNPKAGVHARQHIKYRPGLGGGESPFGGIPLPGRGRARRGAVSALRLGPCVGQSHRHVSDQPAVALGELGDLPADPPATVGSGVDPNDAGTGRGNSA